MVRIRHLLLTLLVLSATFALFNCQQMPLEPIASQTVAPVTYRPVPISPEMRGLAKSLGSDVAYIHREMGGKVGGINTGNNFVFIPPNSLKKDGYIYLTLETVDNPTDPLYGALVFDVSTSTNENSVVKEHIELQDGTSCQLFVSKQWLATPPSAVISTDGSEVITGVKDFDAYWMISVTHFSKWAWIY